MTTEFDPDAGVLRLGHAALAVLARLATAPTDASLTDHATAPPLAELRRAGIVGPGGIDAAVQPLAVVVGAPTARLDLVLDAGADSQRCRGWATRDLLVLGVPAPTTDESYDLVADVPAEAGDLIGELVGLVSAPQVPGDVLELDSAAYAALVAAGPAPGPSAAAGDAGPLAGAVRARWRLGVRAGGEERLEVLDAGDAGLWRVQQIGDRVDLVPADAAALRRRVRDLLAAALA